MMAFGFLRSCNESSDVNSSVLYNRRVERLLPHTVNIVEHRLGERQVFPLV
jgi:hypothetical protein